MSLMLIVNFMENTVDPDQMQYSTTADQGRQSLQYTLFATFNTWDIRHGIKPYVMILLE